MFWSGIGIREFPCTPVYIPEFHCDGTSGGYLRRFSCRVCIFSTDHDLIQIAKHDPIAFARVSDLEQRLGFTMRPGKTLLGSWNPERPPSPRMRCNPASRSEGVGNHIVTIHFMR
jgi:hypothetical protein